MVGTCFRGFGWSVKGAPCKVHDVAEFRVSGVRCIGYTGSFIHIYIYIHNIHIYI